jgi:transposase
MSAFHWFTDQKAVNEIKRILKPGGIFFIVHPRHTTSQRSGVDVSHNILLIWSMNIRHARLEPWKMGRLITEWIFHTPATVAARKLSLNPRTTKLWYQKIREGIWEQKRDPFFEGIVEVDETYLVPIDPQKQRFATKDKIAVFGIYDRKTKKIYAEMIENPNAEKLLPIIQKHIAQGATIHSDGFGAYYHLSKLGYRHYRVLHEHFYSLHPGIHTNNIESFWGYLQSTLSPKRGISRTTYHLHVEEAVFRFNNRDPHKLRYVIKRILNLKE